VVKPYKGAGALVKPFDMVAAQGQSSMQPRDHDWLTPLSARGSGMTGRRLCVIEDGC
jgi:hypothetical protein